MKRTSVSVMILAVVLAWLPCGPALAAWSDIVVFGDSLSDVGNVRERSSDLTFGLFPTPDNRYFNGRFSNGPVWVEQVADTLGLDASTRSHQASGTNYAHGGAITGGGTASFGVIRNLGWQVDEYLIDEGRVPQRDTLVVLWAGGNDFLDGGTSTTQPTDNLIGELQQLFDAGAREFLVPNLPPLGLTPRFLGNPVEAAQQSALIDQHNAYLADQLEGFVGQNDAVVYALDIAELFADLLADPAGSGITNTTQQAIDLPSAADASGYLFWDDVHPTTTAHALIAEAALGLLLPGDYSGDGFVSQSDLDLVLLIWGRDTDTLGVPAGWARQQPTGVIAQAQLDAVLLNWGAGQGAEAVTIPEPAVGLGLAVMLWCVRRQKPVGAPPRPYR